MKKYLALVAAVFLAGSTSLTFSQGGAEEEALAAHPGAAPDQQVRPDRLQAELLALVLEPQRPGEQVRMRFSSLAVTIDDRNFSRLNVESL